MNWRILSGCCLVAVAIVSCTASAKPLTADAPATRVPSPTSAPKPSPTPTSPPIGGRQQPFPAGQAGIIPLSDGKIRIEVVSVDWDAAKRLKTYNMFNSLPKEGQRRIAARIRVTVLESTSEVMSVGSSRYGVVGSANRLYNRTFVVLKEELAGQLYPGGSVEGEVAFDVPEDETGILLIYDSSPVGGARSYFALPE